MRSTTLLSLALFLGACRGEATLAPLEALACEASPPAGSVVELASTLVGVSSVRMGPCGEVLFTDGEGAVFRAGPELVEAERLLLGASSAQLSRRGDQVLVRNASRPTATWLRPADGASSTVDVDTAGFARVGDGEVAWACHDGAIGTLGVAGFSVITEPGSASCDRIWFAQEAPVLAFVAGGVLHAVDLEDGRVIALNDVPFIAASSDQIRLSRDGRFLFHQPSMSPVLRIGIFDLERAQGDRLVAAPEVQTNLFGLVEAQDAGHTVAMRSPTGVLVLTPSGYVNHYESATFIALAPAGDRVLLAAIPPTPGATGYELQISDLDAATLRRAGNLAGLPSSTVVSARGGTVAGWGGASGTGEAATFVFRWETESSRQQIGSAGSWGQLLWVSEAGALLSSFEGTLSLTSPTGAEVHRFGAVYASTAYEVRGGDLLLRESGGGVSADRIVLVDTTSGALEVIREIDAEGSERFDALMIDAAGERFAYVLGAPDEADPLQQRTRVFAGAVP